MGGEVASSSRRVADARSRADVRRARQRAALRPMGWTIVAIVVVSAFDSHPAPALHGNGLAVSAFLVLYVAALAAVLRTAHADPHVRVQTPIICAMGGAGVALSALQSHGATELAPGAAVFTAVARLPLRIGAAIGLAITVGLDVASALGDQSASAILASTLLCATLGLIAYLVRQAREGQDRTELLLAELEDARDAQAEAAALAERARIAGDLHDVLAHSLSGAAIQLQSARVLAERDGAGERLRGAVDRASELVRGGLAEARRAVGALRGDELPTVEQLDRLVESFRADMHMDVTLAIEGEKRTLAPDASLALYRGAQESLTNVARYAPGAATTVVLRYDGERAMLSIEDRARDGVPPAGAGFVGVGGGRGLAGMRERVERAGGRMEAGPTSDGWHVWLEVPV